MVGLSGGKGWGYGEKLGRDSGKGKDASNNKMMVQFIELLLLL